MPEGRKRNSPFAGMTRPNRSHMSNATSRFRKALPWVAFALACVLWHSSWRWPAPALAVNGPVLPPAFDASTPRQDNRLRIAIFNIHRGRDRNGRFALERTAETLEGFDLIGLHEVVGPTFFGQSDQAHLLGQSLNMAAAFLPVQRRFYRDYQGNGLLSRFPIEEWQSQPLPLRARHHRHRGISTCVVRIGEIALTVMITHLDNGIDRYRQLAIALEQFRQHDRAILIGDFNTTRNDPQLRLALNSYADDAIGKHLGDEDIPGRVDWILTRGLRTRAAGIRDLDASDHPCFWIEIELDAPVRLTEISLEDTIATNSP